MPSTNAYGAWLNLLRPASEHADIETSPFRFGSRDLLRDIRHGRDCMLGQCRVSKRRLVEMFDQNVDARTFATSRSGGTRFLAWVSETVRGTN